MEAEKPWKSGRGKEKTAERRSSHAKSHGGEQVAGRAQRSQGAGSSKDR